MVLLLFKREVSNTQQNIIAQVKGYKLKELIIYGVKNEPTGKREKVNI